MDGKISSRAFQRVFFGFFLEFWLIYYDFSKFFAKIDFSEFFDDRPTAATNIRRGERQLVVGTNNRRLPRGNHLEPLDDMAFDD